MLVRHVQPSLRTSLLVEVTCDCREGLLAGLEEDEDGLGENESVLEGR